MNYSIRPYAFIILCSLPSFSQAVDYENLLPVVDAANATVGAARATGAACLWAWQNPGTFAAGTTAVIGGSMYASYKIVKTIKEQIKAHPFIFAGGVSATVAGGYMWYRCRKLNEQLDNVSKKLDDASNKLDNLEKNAKERFKQADNMRMQLINNQINSTEAAKQRHDSLSTQVKDGFADAKKRHDSLSTQVKDGFADADQRHQTLSTQVKDGFADAKKRHDSLSTQVKDGFADADQRHQTLSTQVKDGFADAKKRHDSLSTQVKDGFADADQRHQTLSTQVKDGFADAKKRHDSLSTQVKDGFADADQRHQTLSTQVKDGFEGAEKERNGLSTQVTEGFADADQRHQTLSTQLSGVLSRLEQIDAHSSETKEDVKAIRILMQDFRTRQTRPPQLFGANVFASSSCPQTYCTTSNKAITYNHQD